MVVGAGYIAVELAGILQTLGSEVYQFIRYDKVSSATKDCVQDVFRSLSSIYDVAFWQN